MIAECWQCWRRDAVERETCDTEALSRLVDASGIPPDSDPFRPDSQLEVQHVSRGTYRLFNKTQSRSHLPFIYFELPSDASLLRNSGIYDATTVRDDNTLRADLIRQDVNTWILHVDGELLRCPGAIEGFNVSTEYFSFKHLYATSVFTFYRASAYCCWRAILI